MKTAIASLAVIIFAVGCTASPSKPSFGSKKASTNDVIPGDDPDDLDPNSENVKPGNGKVPTISSVPTEISLDNKKFKGEESKLEALVKYAGTTSAKLKLESSGDGAKLSVPKLTLGKTDVLTVEIYEGQKLRFKATKAATTIDKSKATVMKIEDCAIQQLPWAGESNETLCGWTISVSKN
ncbi:MAG: hypothetical protein EOP04_01665 [Proteobacteria bacterium]|nr:MAG: hypothetical protein EOP04_01665 [Pseudomonadota bacterium]